MRKYNELPSQEYLIECFQYNPESGILKWKQRPLHHFKNIDLYNKINSRFANTVCGYIDKKYWKVKINGKRFLIHRIIWKLVMGTEPKMIIDHVNNNSLDNRLVNLREATPTQNNQNNQNKIICKNNKSGHKGVYWNIERNRFASSIMVDKKSIFLGYFDDPKNAYKAYCIAAIKYFGEFKNIEMDI